MNAKPRKQLLTGEKAREIQQTIPNAKEGGWLRPGSGLLVHFKIMDDNIDYFVRGKRFCGSWKLTVGGAVEEGETFLEAAFREFREEHFNYHIGNPEVIPDVAFFHRKRKQKDGKTTGFDYVTSQARVMVQNKRDLESYVAKLKGAAVAANSALSAMKNSSSKDIESKSRSKLASDALSHGHFVRQLVKEPLGKEVRTLLQDIEKGKQIDYLTSDSQSKLEKAIKIFTEYSDFDIVKSREMLASVKAKDENLFAPEAPVVLELLTYYFGR
mmetsp:Transcript_2272/g.3176  ORF Transcript_2272/g.3176 Transcript_2272/m.3176 type:complete len:270 (-) Transcript_2272:974-1783(-)